jgi:hypothetical protein
MIPTWRPGSSLQGGGAPQKLPVRQPPQQGTAARQENGVHPAFARSWSVGSGAGARPRAVLHQKTAPAAATVGMLRCLQLATHLSLAPAEATAATPCRMRAMSSCRPAIAPRGFETCTATDQPTRSEQTSHTRLACGVERRRAKARSRMQECRAPPARLPSNRAFMGAKRSRQDAGVVQGAAAPAVEEEPEGQRRRGRRQRRQQGEAPLGPAAGYAEAVDEGVKEEDAEAAVSEQVRLQGAAPPPWR